MIMEIIEAFVWFNVLWSGVPTLEVRSGLACLGGLRGNRGQGQKSGSVRLLPYWGLRRTALADPGPHHHFQQSSETAGSAHLLYRTCPALTILNFLLLRAAMLPFPLLGTAVPQCSPGSLFLISRDCCCSAAKSCPILL